MPSFDVVSQVDLQEVSNAIQTSLKEIYQRFDFKGTKTEIELDPKEKFIKVLSDNEYKLEAVKNVLYTRLNKRGISPKSLDPQKIEVASGSMSRQVLKLISGLSSENAKEINKFIKEMKIKVTSETQKEQVRVTGKSRDDLQEVITALKGKDFGPPLNFINFRD